MTHSHTPITHALKTLSLCVLIIALVKADALSRYWQQQWRIALPFAGHLSEPTWFNQFWMDHFYFIDQCAITLHSRLTRAGQALSADPIKSLEPAPIVIQPCEQSPTEIGVLPMQKKVEWPIPLSSTDKVLLVGDSMMQGVAPYVGSGLRKQYGVETLDLSKHSTGLAYPGFFNWPDTIKETLAKTTYKALVVFLGANDTWDIIHKGKAIAVGSEQWYSLYSERIESILTNAQENSVQVIWLGAPAMGRENMNKNIPALNKAYETSVRKFAPAAIFIPTAPNLSRDNENFSKFLTLPEQGEIMVRTNDGVHFTPAGQKIIARIVLNNFRATTPEMPTQ